MNDEVNYANAPWVPLYITSSPTKEVSPTGIPTPSGMLDKTVKKGYSFRLSFTPFPNYTFKGWQAWIEGEGVKAWWLNDDQKNPYGKDWVVFKPLNGDGTEVEIFVYEIPSSGKPLFIGPWGADIDDLKIAIDSNGLGTISPVPLDGVRLGYPFTVRFLPDDAYKPFRGWEMYIRNGNEKSKEISTWNVGGKITGDGDVEWTPSGLELSGQEMRVTIKNLPDGVDPKDNNFVIGPIGWDSGEPEVIVDVQGWGTPTRTGKLSGIRNTFPFTVEFTPSTDYAFVKWLAYSKEDYDKWLTEWLIAREKNYNEWLAFYREKDYEENGPTAGPLSSEEVAIEEDIIVDKATGKVKATANVTVKENTDQPIVLVPWCYERPRLQQTNPPLNQILTPFPFDQPVSLKFTMPVKKSTLNWENIRISGNYTSGSGRGLPFNKNGEKDGDLKEYFTLESPGEDYVNYVILKPKSDTDLQDRALKDLALLSISVTVGQEIESKTGVTMAQAETIKYQTDTREMQRTYLAANITARRDGDTKSFGDDTTKYPWNSPQDRRFNQSDKKTVYIKFSVTPPETEGSNSVPNRITIIERLTFDLKGDIISGQLNKKTIYEDEDPDLYFENNVYTISHTLKTKKSGIIRLLVLPWDTDASGEPLPEDINKAENEGQYVTIVMDLEPPGFISDRKLTLKLDGAKEDGGEYKCTPGNNNITLSVDKEGLEKIVADNGTERGIQLSEAWEKDKPWTMDDISDLTWYFQIAKVDKKELMPIGKLNPHKKNNLPDTCSFDITDKLKTSETYWVFVKFEDKMGNISDEWTKTDCLVRYVDIPSPVIKPNAQYNTAEKSITVKWTTPERTDGANVYVYLNDTYLYKEFISGTVDTESTYPIKNVLPINDTGVKYGMDLEVMRYKVDVEACRSPENDPDNKADKMTLFVCNIPDMYVDQDTVPLTQDNFVEKLVSNSANTYVLTEKINIPLSTRWKPIEGFTGKFYGNGYTVTINNMEYNDTGSGLFASAADKALIRDLTVSYGENQTPSISAVKFGGVCGDVAGSTKILNTIVKGAANVNGRASVISAGGLAGYLGTGATIENCYSALDVTTTNSSINMGGIVGDNYGTVSKCTVANDLIIRMDSFGQRNMGGIAGESYGTVKNCDVKGNLKLTGSSPSSLSSHAFGGIIGRMKGGNLSYSKFTGNIEFPSSYSTSGETSIGGAVGKIDDINAAVIVRNITASGSINFSVNSVSGPTSIGGAVGKIADINAAVTVSNITASGNITFKNSGVGDLNLGGICGYSNGASATYNVTFDKCEYKGKIEVGSGTGASSASTYKIGGFIGEIASNTTLKNNCGSSASRIEVFQGGELYVGGFAGLIQSSVDSCFSQSPVTVDVKTDKPIYVGGFAGQVSSSSGTTTITKSFASGAVKVTKTGSGNTYAAGFAGYGSGSVQFNNSYAVGGVSVEQTSGTVYASGFLGCTDNASVKIDKCFAAGTVWAQSSSGAAIFAGGLVGYTNNGSTANNPTIENSAALGLKVTAESSGTKKTGRVIGETYSGNAGKNNYALSGMRLERSKSTSALYPDPQWTGTAPEPDTYFTVPNLTTAADAAKNDGRDVTKTESEGENFWKSTSTPGLGFDGTTVWNLDANVLSRGYPKLRWEQ